jgi:hypothetical protein
MDCKQCGKRMCDGMCFDHGPGERCCPRFPPCCWYDPNKKPRRAAPRWAAEAYIHGEPGSIPGRRT